MKYAKLLQFLDLLQFAWGKLSQPEQEKIEKLEQLRVLHAGYAILVGVIQQNTLGIDTPEDYRAFVEKHHAR
jgi:3-deoxy-manno-octulosonate cytidylyltransferase (CMP-KDO synthetase)